MLEYRKFRKDDDLEAVLGIDVLEIEKREAWAALGKDVRSALLYSIDNSQDVWVITYNDKVCGVFGLAVHLFDGKRVGIPWMLSDESPFLSVNRMKFVRVSKDIIALMSTKCDSMVNVISVFNKRSIKWLRRLGFDFCAEPFCFERDPSFWFYQFYKEVRA